MLHTRFVCLLAWGWTSFAYGTTGFPMPKPGEWNVREVGTESKPKNSGTVECIQTQDKKNWENDFKKAASENGMDCQLTVKSETASRLAYDIQCKGRRSESGASTVQVYSQDAEGSLVFNRKSETSYIIEQEIKLRGMKPDDKDSKEMSAKQKRMVDAAMRHSTDSTTTRMKNEYTFVGPKCKSTPVK